MDKDLQKFMKWVEKKLFYLHPSQYQKVLIEIKSYLEEVHLEQKTPYRELIKSLGNRVQFVNGFLIKIGIPPLPLGRSWLRIFSILTLSLFLSGFITSVAFYYYVKSQFSFDLEKGEIKFFGEKLGNNDQKFSTLPQFHQQYVQKIINIKPLTPLEIKLDHTRMTISYDNQKTNLLTISCELDHDQKLNLSSQKNYFLIEAPGSSNCDLILPALATFKASFSSGKLTVDQPLKSFEIYGDKGQITWIKNLKTKHNISYDVNTVNIQGSTEDIFQQNSPHKAHIQLETGSLSFLDPL